MHGKPLCSINLKLEMSDLEELPFSMNKFIWLLGKISLSIFNYRLSLYFALQIVCCGPLTNIATCLISDGGQDFSSKLKGLVIMGGNSEGIGNITTCAEFNFHADPEAAFVVLQRCNSSIQLVTWETCRYGNYVDWVNNIICHN